MNNIIMTEEFPDEVPAEPKISYRGYHLRVSRKRGKADHCVFGCISDRFEWANLMGEYDNLEDYAPMCLPCHRRFDKAQHFWYKCGHPKDTHFTGFRERTRRGVERTHTYCSECLSG